MALTPTDVDNAVPTGGTPSRALTNAALKQLITDIVQHLLADAPDIATVDLPALNGPLGDALAVLPTSIVPLAFAVGNASGDAVSFAEQFTFEPPLEGETYVKLKPPTEEDLYFIVGDIEGFHVALNAGDGYAEVTIGGALNLGIDSNGLYLTKYSAPLIVTGLPTSDPEIAGALWSDPAADGALKLSAGPP